MAAQAAKSGGERGAIVLCPVTVHRWFSGGEGWAWGSQGTPKDFVERLAEVLRTRPAKAQAGLVEDGPRWWFYHHAPDPDPLDPKAQGRQPSILRAVALPGQPRSDYRDLLAHRLAEIPLPDQPGETPGLFLEVPQLWLEAPEKAKGPFGLADEKVARGPSAARRLAWRVLLVGVIVACVAALVMVLVCPTASSGGGVSVNDVRERLLEPLGVELPPDASADQVYEAFRHLYCQRGMVEHFFPGAKSNEVKDLFSNITQLSGGNPGSSETGTSDEPKHPDVCFARQRGAKQLNNVLSVIAVLLEEPVKKEEPVFAGKRTVLSRAVIKVASSISPQERQSSGSDSSVTCYNAVRVLERCVVNRLKDLFPKDQATRSSFRGEYERWFEEFRWRVGEPFPWDERPEPKCRKLALLFCERKHFPDDVRQAAEEMLKFLQERRVEGLSEEDVWERPWFVGRCFVEFLSLKHFDDGERKQLDTENSLHWEQLKRLPLDGWPESGRGRSAEQANPWQMVRTRLQELAKKLDVDTAASDAALVQQIANTIAHNWPAEVFQAQLDKQAREDMASDTQKQMDRLQNDLDQLKNQMEALDKEVRKLEAELPKHPLEDSERPKLEQERNAKKREWEELKKREERLKQEKADLEEKLKQLKSVRADRPLRSTDEKVTRLWNRLTGEKQKAAEGPAGR